MVGITGNDKQFPLGLIDFDSECLVQKKLKLFSEGSYSNVSDCFICVYCL